MQIEFPSDTKHRKQFFDDKHFAHPAKMHLSLLRWIVDRYTKEGEVILDPMAGAGTTMLACQTGRNVILEELEEKFIQVCRDNWTKVQKYGAEMGYEMGGLKLLNGDARCLDMLIPNMEVLDQIDRDTKIAILYLLIGKMNNGKSLVLEVFVPSSLADLIPMPITPISLDNELPFRDEEIHDISSDSSLLLECEGLIGQLCPDNPFDISFVHTKAATIRAENSTPINKRFTRIKGLATTGALEIATPTTSDTFTLRGTENTLTILCLGIPSKEWLAAYLAGVRNSVSLIGIPTSTGAEIPLCLSMTWANLNCLSALLTSNSWFNNSFLASETTNSRAEPTSSAPQIGLGDTKVLAANFTNSYLHSSIIQLDANDVKQGDARVLDGVVDCVVTSPPYAHRSITGESDTWRRVVEESGRNLEAPSKQGIREGFSANEDQISNLPYGAIDVVLTSPPYAEADARKPSTGIIEQKSWSAWNIDQRDATKSNLYNDLIFMSPEWLEDRKEQAAKRNIGTLPYSAKDSDFPTYLEAMLLVYRNCHAVLKPQGLMVLVTKNFIRDKSEVRLDEDTIKLCEQAGFEFMERHYRKLTSQSFWRTIAQIRCDHRRGSKTNPKCKLGLECPVVVTEGVIARLIELESGELTAEIERIEKLCPQYVNSIPVIDREDVLVFKRGAPEFTRGG